MIPYLLPMLQYKIGAGPSDLSCPLTIRNSQVKEEFRRLEILGNLSNLEHNYPEHCVISRD